MREEIYTFGQYRDGKRPLNVTMAGISWCDSSYRIQRAIYEEYTVAYVTEGEGELDVCGRNYSLQAGDTWFLHTGLAHRYACKGNVWNMIWVEMQGRLVDALTDVYLPERPQVIRGMNILADMEKMLDVIRDREHSYEDITRQAALFLHAVLMRAGQFGSRETVHPSGRIKAYVDSHLHQPLRLETLASEMGYSQNHIINLFRADYGMTPYVYYEQQKMQEAGELLRNSAMNISEIAARLGYDSPQYFTKRFKKFLGMTPSSYRAGGQ